MISTKKNRQELIELMNHHRVSIAQVAELLRKKPSLVTAYRSIGGTDISDNDLELLHFKLARSYPVPGQKEF